MRIAILSDIHGNVRGLDACLDDLDAQGGADVLVAAGDLCLDGPRPVEVLERLQDRNALCVRGNTDRMIVESAGGPAACDTLDPEETAACAWQRERLGPVWLAWLRELPFARRFGDGSAALLVVHANPKSDDEHVWPDADDAFLERITQDVSERTIAFGHLHLPYVRMWRDRLLVDVASAGLPKDGDARASYSLFTQRSGGCEVKQRRVPYDVDAAVHDLKKSDMPDAARCIKVLRRARYKQLTERIP